MRLALARTAVTILLKALPATTEEVAGIAPTQEMLERRRDILERLAQGTLSAQEAAEALRENL